MKRYLWMMDFTPQREWIDRQGLLLWLAFFFSEVGAGIYLVSLFLEFWAGCVIGWLSCALLGGGLHLAYLGKPLRVLRAISRPRTSELSRGMIAMGLFLFLGLLQMAPSLSLFSGLPWTSHAMFFKVVLAILGVFVILHGFITLSVISALPFWNSAIVPVLSLASGIWLGTQLVTGLGMGLNQDHLLVALEPTARWSLFSYVFLTIFYLWNANYSSRAAKRSLDLLIRGELAPLFHVGVVVIALLVPTLITLLFYTQALEPTEELLFTRALCAFMGDLTLRYCILKAARYFPLVESNVITGTGHQGS